MHFPLNLFRSRKNDRTIHPTNSANHANISSSSSSSSRPNRAENLAAGRVAIKDTSGGYTVCNVKSLPFQNPSTATRIPTSRVSVGSLSQSLSPSLSQSLSHGLADAHSREPVYIRNTSSTQYVCSRNPSPTRSSSPYYEEDSKLRETRRSYKETPKRQTLSLADDTDPCKSIYDRCKDPSAYDCYKKSI